MEECRYVIRKNKMENLIIDYINLILSDESDNESDNESGNVVMNLIVHLIINFDNGESSD